MSDKSASDKCRLCGVSYLVLPLDHHQVQTQLFHSPLPLPYFPSWVHQCYLDPKITRSDLYMFND